MIDLNNFNYTDNVHDVLAVYVNRLLAATLRSEYKNVETLSADRELTNADTPIQRFDCNGANRIVKVPASDAVNNHPFWVVNASAGAYTITVKSNDAVTTHAIINQGEAVLVLPDGAGGYLAEGTRYLLASGLSDWNQQASSPANPATGKMKLFFKNDEKLYKRNPSGTEVEVGSGDLTKIPIQGGMINGKISATVATNNLTVAIKTLAGADPSASDPVYIRIGDTVRSITSALSVTKNAGTNWFSSGASELATFEVDYFVYIGYNATDGITIGFSRIPYARVYGDFNTTSTNEKYCAISTITNAASTDNYELVGRFNAILSAGAGYTWSIPATSIQISRPIFESRWLSWLPTYSGSASMTFSTVTTTQAVYKIDGDEIIISVDFNGTTGGTASFAIQLSAPMKMNSIKMPGIPYLPCYVIDSTKPGGYLRYAQAAFDGIHAERLDEANWGLGSGRYVRGSLIYAI